MYNTTCYVLHPGPDARQHVVLVLVGLPGVEDLGLQVGQPPRLHNNNNNNNNKANLMLLLLLLLLLLLQLLLLEIITQY